MRKVAIVHEWFTTKGGSENVISQLLDLYPDADVFSLFDFMPEHERGFLNNKRIRTSFLQGIPFLKRNYRLALPLMPFAIEQFDLSDYELIISSNHAVAKGVICRPDQFHVSYIHSPIRYAWDMESEYLSSSGLRKFFIKPVLHYIRFWDLASSSRPDILIANSKFIARRIIKSYRRSAEVIYPPVDTNFFTIKDNSNCDYYLAASRFVEYKKIDLIASAFKFMPQKNIFRIVRHLFMQQRRILGFFLLRFNLAVNR
jgi:glycosyltransferase involved in cell wall biosynthesis